MNAALLIRLDPGTPRVGLWCPDCLLPSRVEVPLYRLTPDGVVRVGTVSFCPQGQD